MGIGRLRMFCTKRTTITSEERSEGHVGMFLNPQFSTTDPVVTVNSAI